MLFPYYEERYRNLRTVFLGAEGGQVTGADANGGIDNTASFIDRSSNSQGEHGSHGLPHEAGGAFFGRRTMRVCCTAQNSAPYPSGRRCRSGTGRPRRAASASTVPAQRSVSPDRSVRQAHGEGHPARGAARRGLFAAAAHPGRGHCAYDHVLQQAERQR